VLRHLPCNPHASIGLVFAVILMIIGALPVRAAVHLRDTSGPGGQLMGQAISALADVNSDGRSEFLVGAPGDSRPGAEAGRVFFWFGGQNVTEAAAREYDGAAGDWFGFDVASIGDVNGDGQEDWAAGAPYADAGAAESGRLYVFFGTANPAASGLASLQADLVISGASAGDHFGHSVAAAGDFNGDGKDDFIVGAPYSNLRAAAAGAAYVIYGSNGAPSADLADATVLTGQGAGDHFGWSVTGAGNFLGRAEESVAVGAPLNNTHGGLDAGAVYVFEGAIHPAQPDTSIEFASGVSHAAKAGSEYGYSLSHAGRWNTDGLDDLIVGAPYCAAGATESGRIEIIYGATSPDPQGDRYVDGELAYDHFGFSVARGYDIAGSSADDVLIGAPHHNDGASDSGRAYLMEGGSTVTAAGNLTIISHSPLNPDNPADDLYGFDVASAGDFDGDGVGDYAVSAPAANLPNNAVAGTCHVLDSSGMAVPVFVNNWLATWRIDGSIDLLLAANVDPWAVQWVDVTRQMVHENSGQFTEISIHSGPLGWGDQGFYYNQQGYHLLDVGLDSELAHAGNISYEVVFAMADGSSVILGSLAGPAGGPVALLATTLSAPWPNPCNPGTSLDFVAPRGTQVMCRVLDIRGSQIRTLFTGPATGTTQNIFWDGRDAARGAVASGVYLVQLVSPQSILSRRVVLAR
jgi:hypothetical protein